MSAYEVCGRCSRLGHGAADCGTTLVIPNAPHDSDMCGQVDRCHCRCADCTRPPKSEDSSS